MSIDTAGIGAPLSSPRQENLALCPQKGEIKIREMRALPFPLNRVQQLLQVCLSIKEKKIL